MRDFLGEEIAIGNFLAKGGGGNGSGNYGMVLYRVRAIKNDKLFVTKLSVNYHPSKEVVVKKTTIKNPNSVVIVNPGYNIVGMFEDIVDKQNTPTADVTELIGTWLHGTESFDSSRLL